MITNEILFPKIVVALLESWFTALFLFVVILIVYKEKGFIERIT